MSFYPLMFKPPVGGDEVKTYVVHINDLGDTIVYWLAPDGSAKSFVTGKATETLGEPLKAANPRARIVHLGPQGEPPHEPWDYGLRGDTWAEFVKLHNGKGVTAGMMRERYNRLGRHDIDVPYVEQETYYKLKVTQAGLDADARLKDEEGES